MLRLNQNFKRLQWPAPLLQTTVSMTAMWQLALAVLDVSRVQRALWWPIIRHTWTYPPTMVPTITWDCRYFKELMCMFCHLFHSCFFAEQQFSFVHHCEFIIGMECVLCLHITGHKILMAYSQKCLSSMLSYTYPPPPSQPHVVNSIFKSTLECK